MASNPSEFELIARYFTRAPRTALLGVGDDCALVQAGDGQVLAISTDMLVEGTHFLSGTDPERLGHKTLAVNLSDLAAMGADPRWVTLALALPRVDEAWIAAFARGFFALADRSGVELIGGDTTRGPLNLCVTIMGTVPARPPGSALRRDGARAGETVWVSGETGAAAIGLAALKGEIALGAAERSACIDRLERPEPRVALGRALRGVATSAIDVSDGLVADLGHIAERSKVAIEIELARVPVPGAIAALAERDRVVRAVLAGGDDYELAFTAPAHAEAAVRAAATKAGVPVTPIGRVAAGGGVTVRDPAGAPLALIRRGFDHFD